MTLTIDQNGVVNIGEPQGGGTYDWTVYGSLVIGVDNETGVWTLGNPPRIHGDLTFDKKGTVDGERYTVPVPHVKFVLTGTSDYGTNIRMILTGGADGIVHINKLKRLHKDGSAALGGALNIAVNHGFGLVFHR